MISLFIEGCNFFFFFNSPENRNGVDYLDDQSVIVSALLTVSLKTTGAGETQTRKHHQVLILRRLLTWTTFLFSVVNSDRSDRR